MQLPVHINLARLNHIQLLDNIIQFILLGNIPERYSVGYFEVLRPINNPLSILPHSITYGNDYITEYTPKFPSLFINTKRQSDLLNKIPSMDLYQFFIKYFYVRCFMETGSIVSTFNTYTGIKKFFIKVTELDLKLLEEILLHSISPRDLPSNLNYFIVHHTQHLNQRSWKSLRDLYSNIKDYRDKGFTVYFYAY